MHVKWIWMAGIALAGSCVVAYPVLSAPAQKSSPVKMHRLYTGADGQTHVEEIMVDFGPGGVNGFKLKAGAGAEIRRAPPGRVADWHTAPRRQYVITLSGRGEVELIDGTKIELGPGSIDLAEDLTGKGHITRVVGNEDRITLAIPVSDK
jgi:quercetin dioxygenase-like cupin family protein